MTVSKTKAGAWAAAVLWGLAQVCERSCPWDHPCAGWLREACWYAEHVGMPLAMAFGVGGLRDAITKHGFTWTRNLRRKPAAVPERS